MTLMKNKKIYTAPTLEILEFKSENLLLGSPTKDVIIDNNVEIANPEGEGGNYGDAWMSNKNNSWNHTWE